MAIEINTIFTKNRTIVRRSGERDWTPAEGGVIEMVLPLSLCMENGEYFTLPIEPLISITGKNTIVKRNVAKQSARGTVKERWAEDDFQICIEGCLRGQDERTYPEDSLTTLYRIVTRREPIGVKNELLQMLGIHYIVVEDYSFPFSKGEDVQNYVINAVSDEISNLFIDMSDV